MDETEQRHTMDLVHRVLDDIGSECNGVEIVIQDIPVGTVMKPHVILRWDPTIHPKTIHDPPQAIMLESMATGRPLKDDTLRRVLRERIEHMLKVDMHATVELIQAH